MLGSTVADLQAVDALPFGRRRDGGPHRLLMLRFLLLRFLPRRLVPLLTVLEIALLVWGWRKRKGVTATDVSTVTAPRR
jgi:hypothetical protein